MCLCTDDQEETCNCGQWEYDLLYPAISPDIWRCTCGTPTTCTCVMADMVEVAATFINDEDKYLTEGESVKEAMEVRENFGSSVTLKVSNFLKDPLAAVRTSAKAGEIEIPQCDVKPLCKESLLCKRITRASAKNGCAGTANFRIGESDQYLHIMWSSPNNFDKHASHLAVGITDERTDKFNDMYYQRPTWFARKYVYHDTQGIWFSCPDHIIHARSFTRPVADVEVYVFPADANELPPSLLEVVKNM